MKKEKEIIPPPGSAITRARAIIHQSNLKSIPQVPRPNNTDPVLTETEEIEARQIILKTKLKVGTKIGIRRPAYHRLIDLFCSLDDKNVCGAALIPNPSPKTPSLYELAEIMEMTEALNQRNKAIKQANTTFFNKIQEQCKIIEMQIEDLNRPQEKTI